ncbi:cyclin-like F-box containing protein, partial [Reticulomyxa filosa]
LAIVIVIVNDNDNESGYGTGMYGMPMGVNFGMGVGGFGMNYPCPMPAPYPSTTAPNVHKDDKKAVAVDPHTSLPTSGQTACAPSDRTVSQEIDTLKSKDDANKNSTKPGLRIGEWQSYITKEGNVYYFNLLTQTTTWSMPKEFEQSVATNTVPSSSVANPILTQPNKTEGSDASSKDLQPPLQTHINANSDHTNTNTTTSTIANINANSNANANANTSANATTDVNADIDVDAQIENKTENKLNSQSEHAATLPTMPNDHFSKN